MRCVCEIKVSRNHVCAVQNYSVWWSLHWAISIFNCSRNLNQPSFCSECFMWLQFDQLILSTTQTAWLQRSHAKCNWMHWNWKTLQTEYLYCWDLKKTCYEWYTPTPITTFLRNKLMMTKEKIHSLIQIKEWRYWRTCKTFPWSSQWLSSQFTFITLTRQKPQFLQIKVDPKDRDALRLLQYENFHSSFKTW